jgi:ABC-type uncharacterized transport system auxiliary subunit
VPSSMVNEYRKWRSALNKLWSACLACLLLSACISLPGSEDVPPVRYMLQPAGSDCAHGQTPLGLSVVKVGSGLNTDRIARRDASTGKFTYLKEVRWVDRTGSMMEQRLAEDLECRGYTVITSHRSRLSHAELVCEVRAMNLVRDSSGDSAEVALSCFYFDPGTKSEIALQASGSGALQSWSAPQAAAAASAGYRQTFDKLVSQLPGATQ